MPKQTLLIVLSILSGIFTIFLYAGIIINVVERGSLLGWLRKKDGATKKEKIYLSAAFFLACLFGLTAVVVKHFAR